MGVGFLFFTSLPAHCRKDLLTPNMGGIVLKKKSACGNVVSRSGLPEIWGPIFYARAPTKAINASFRQWEAHYQNPLYQQKARAHMAGYDHIKTGWSPMAQDNFPTPFDLKHPHGRPEHDPKPHNNKKTIGELTKYIWGAA